MKLTDKQIKQIGIACAEADGWHFSKRADEESKAVAVMCWVKPGGNDWEMQELPNYPASFDAIIPAVQRMSESDKRKMDARLHQTIRYTFVIEHFCELTPLDWCVCYLRVKNPQELERILK